MMTRERAIKQLKAQVENDDLEAAHEEADFILCELLEALGYLDVVEVWREVGKYYA